MPQLQPVHYVFLAWSAAVGLVCGFLQAKYPGFRDGALPPLAYVFVGIAVGEALLIFSGKVQVQAGGAVPMPVRIMGLALAAGFLLLSPSIYG